MRIIKNDISILIIDDEEISRLLLRHILKGDGYGVINEAADGETGLKLTRQLKPDVVCLDVMMPDCNGIEVLQQIKTHSPRTVVLMVSGSSDRDTVVSAVQSKTDGYIIKPFDARKLLRTVEQSYAKAHGFGL